MSKRRTVHRMTFGDWGGSPEILEARLVLNGAGASSAVIAGIKAGATRSVRALRISERVDSAFNAFTSDYLDAQAAYFEAVRTNSSNSSAIVQAYKNVVNQRVNLLAQDLIRAMSRLPNATIRERGESETPLESFLRKRITSPDSSTSLRTALTANDAVPAVGLPAADIEASATLFTLNATNAISAARVSTINAAKFLAGGVFAPKHR